MAGKQLGELCTGGWEGTVRTVHIWQRRNMANCKHVVWKEQGDLCTADIDRNRENSVVQVAGKEQR